MGEFADDMTLGELARTSAPRKAEGTGGGVAVTADKIVHGTRSTKIRQYRSSLPQLCIQLVSHR